MAKLLVVEDDDAIRALVATRLVRAGHQVLDVASPAEALGALEGREPPDAVVLDVNLPGMDGYQLLERLRGLPGYAELPVVFLSANVSAADVERGRAVGARYLTKPFVANALLAAVQQALGDGAEQPGTARGW